MPKKPCQAKVPTSCRYHGSIHVHREQLKESLNEYKDAMVQQLRAGRVTPELKELVQKASDEYHKRQAVVDAHDNEYKKLKKELADLDYAKEGENPESLDHEFNLEYANVKKRIKMAKAVRVAGKNE
jgi:protein subunit release factor A